MLDESSIFAKLNAKFFYLKDGSSDRIHSMMLVLAMYKYVGKKRKHESEIARLGTI